LTLKIIQNYWLLLLRPALINCINIVVYIDIYAMILSIFNQFINFFLRRWILYISSQLYIQIELLLFSRSRACTINDPPFMFLILNKVTPLRGWDERIKRETVFIIKCLQASWTVNPRQGVIKFATAWDLLSVKFWVVQRLTDRFHELSGQTTFR
jgi:hypothetical protein